MGAHSESLGASGDDPEPTGESGIDSLRLESLIEAVAAIGREVEVLGRQVTDLAGTVESLGADVSASSGVDSVSYGADGHGAERRDPARRGRRSSDSGIAVEILVSPIPELALAALAETTVRGLDGVWGLSEVIRVDDSIRFSVQADPGADLVDEIRQAMPVPVSVMDSDEGTVSLALEWT